MTWWRSPGVLRDPTGAGLAGYSGWSPGQLDDELQRDSWLTHPASIDLVFHTKPQQLWQLILQQKGGKYRLLSQTPEDLSWN